MWYVALNLIVQVILRVSLPIDRSSVERLPKLTVHANPSNVALFACNPICITVSLISQYKCTKERMQVCFMHTFFAWHHEKKWAHSHNLNARPRIQIVRPVKNQYCSCLHLTSSTFLLKNTSPLKCILGFSCDWRLVWTRSIKVPSHFVSSYEQQYHVVELGLC